MEESSVPPIDPDFEPQSRPRSCTWPLPRPDISAVKPESADGTESAAGTPPADEDKPEPQQITSEPEKAAAAAAAGEGGVVAGVGGAGATPRKGSSRRNAWGNQSYADLISQAIENSPEKRLTLAQIYEWMVKTVPYFRDKGDSNSSAGWKVSAEGGVHLYCGELQGALSAMSPLFIALQLMLHHRSIVYYVGWAILEKTREGISL